MEYHKGGRKCMVELAASTKSLQTNVNYLLQTLYFFCCFLQFFCWVYAKTQNISSTLKKERTIIVFLLKTEQ